MKQRLFNYKLFLLFLFITISANGQKNDKSAIIDLLEKSKEMYEKEMNFSINSNYKLYANYKSNFIVEDYNGVLVKKANQNYSKIENTEFINLKGHFLHIDNKAKLIEYNKKEPSESAVALFDFMKFLNNFSGFTLTKEGAFHVCTFTSPDITFVPYNKVTIYINSVDLTISKQVFYLLLLHEYKEKGIVKKDYPKLEISFNNFNTQNIKYDTKFNLANYFSINKGKYNLSKDYKGYRIIDSKQ